MHRCAIPARGRPAPAPAARSPETARARARCAAPRRRHAPCAARRCGRRAGCRRAPAGSCRRTLRCGSLRRGCGRTPRPAARASRRRRSAAPAGGHDDGQRQPRHQQAAGAPARHHRHRNTRDRERDAADHGVVNRRQCLQRDQHAEEDGVAPPPAGDQPMPRQKRQRKEVERLQLQVLQVREVIRAETPRQASEISTAGGADDRADEGVHGERAGDERTEKQQVVAERESRGQRRRVAPARRSAAACGPNTQGCRRRDGRCWRRRRVRSGARPGRTAPSACPSRGSRDSDRDRRDRPARRAGRWDCGQRPRRQHRDDGVEQERQHEPARVVRRAHVRLFGCVGVGVRPVRVRA